MKCQKRPVNYDKYGWFMIGGILVMSTLYIIMKARTQSAFDAMDLLVLGTAFSSILFAIMIMMRKTKQKIKKIYGNKP